MELNCGNHWFFAHALTAAESMSACARSCGRLREVRGTEGAGGAGGRAVVVGGAVVTVTVGGAVVTVTVEGRGVVTDTVEVIDGAAVELGFGPPRRVGATVIATSTTITATQTATTATMVGHGMDGESRSCAGGFCS